MSNKMFFTPEEVENISNNVSLIDYFTYLENKGAVKFDRKTGHDHYFITDNNKYSVTNNRFYDFKNGTGGQVIKAVMQLENKTWLEALNFLKNFNNTIDLKTIDETQVKREKEPKTATNIEVEKVIRPFNNKLLEYFEKRGIDKEIIVENAKQVHYKVNDKPYFGLGLENLSGGFEIRNPMMKTKIGRSDISVIKGSKQNEIIVFEGMTDALSFLQLLKDNNKENNRTLVILNSVTNVDSFTEKYKNFEGNVYLLLDGDKAGNEATINITNSLEKAVTKDVRLLYQVEEGKNKDLNDYLGKKKLSKEIFTNLVTPNKKENERNQSQSERVPNSQSNRREPTKQNDIKSNTKSESEQRGNSKGRLGVDSNNVGDGLTGRTNDSFGERRRGSSSSKMGENRSSQQKNVGEKHALDGWVLKNSTGLPKLDNLIEKYKGQKLTNEQVAEVVSVASFVSDNKTILLKENLNITKDLKDILNQFKSGGTTKEGPGILDEYYTDTKIVNAVRKIINKELDNTENIHVLEPSVGLGNFIEATKNLSYPKINSFEINETTAKIAKILHPKINVNLRSFETEFIEEDGTKKYKESFSNKYDLIIGNPPYGSHRGFYKGLGEESKISRYEDYFVKRSLDTLKNGGLFAMVLPSGWLNKQKKLNDAEIINAYRLPSGAFAGTEVGTDIVILKKNEQKKNIDISNYFENNTNHILGEVRERTNRFGKLENYVFGSLEEALSKIEQLQNSKPKWRLGNLFEDQPLQELTTQTNTKPKIESKEQKLEKKNAEIKINEVLEILQSIKFKSPTVKKDIKKYNSILDSIENNTIPNEELKIIVENANKIITNKKKFNSSEYHIQDTPTLKRNILKYQFNKNDEIVDASVQNNPNITEKEIKAFYNTEYDGQIGLPDMEFKQYANYINQEWIHNFYYAEGNIYKKLDQLEKDFGNKKLDEKQYQKQKDLLMNVLPRPKELEDIIISPNHEFVHNFYIGKKEKEVYNNITKRKDTLLFDYTLADKFKDFVSELPSEVFQGSSDWEVRAFVDNETVTGSDRERNALIRERRKEIANELFDTFLNEELSEEIKNRFVNEFNINYNNIYVPDYSQFPLFSKIHQNFKGKPLRLTEVQKAGIGRLTTKGVGVLAHEVGFGKTLSGILSMHEAMERGNAKRPLIVVPNDNILKQWVETIFETIPDAKVNVLGSLGKNYDLSNFNNQDNEITLVTYSGFNNIGFSKEITDRLANKFSYISKNELKSITNTNRENYIEAQKVNELKGKMKRGKVYDWEDFGFDHLTFDEVHNANHIVGKVRIEDRRFASDFRSQNQRTSTLGINTWMASQYIQEENDGRNVTLLSATPFTNKPLEYYSILSLVANNRLEEQGYFNVNTFFETFMEADNEMEINATGDVQYKTNVRRFKNNALFQQLLSEFIDIKGEEDNPELVRPNRINKEYKIQQNSFTQEQYELLNQNFSQEEDGAILTHILNARLIAISPYLSPYYDGEEPTVKEFVENSPKLKATMDLTLQNKKDNPNVGQIIYSELAVKEFPKLKDYLINEVGFKNDEVAIITGQTSKAQRIKIQNDFNEGKIKVVIGSSAIQEGMNLQKNTSDISLLTLPYNFTTLRQIEGRAWRQGNKFENVRINYMLTEDSIDVFMLQKLQAKQARYLEAMKKDVNILDISDINTSDLKTALITNPVTRAEIEMKVLKQQLESQKSKLIADASFVAKKMETVYNLEDRISKYIEKTNWIEENYAPNSEKYQEDVKNRKSFLNVLRNQLKLEINKLEEKGINAKAVEQNNKLTDEKVKAIDEKIDKLPDKQIELANKYKVEQEEKAKTKNSIDWISERAEENKTFFKLREEIAEKKETVSFRKR